MVKSDINKLYPEQLRELVLKIALQNADIVYDALASQPTKDVFQLETPISKLIERRIKQLNQVFYNYNLNIIYIKGGSL